MSLRAAGVGRSASPASSGRSSPVPRASRRPASDSSQQANKALRRFGAVIERALGSWEISPQEWADYIAFLARLLKAIQSRPSDILVLPRSAEICSRLAQCLNPALPSGVHQKALEVYAYIFEHFGPNYVPSHLHECLPGLSPVLSFASLSVRPLLYSIFEDHILHLSGADLRPALKSLVLSLLPALEEETSEDFERALRITDSLGSLFMKSDSGERDGYFWQCLLLAVITNPSRRQGALNYLSRKLPVFATPVRPEPTEYQTVDQKLSPSAERVVTPEPGLLIRAFVCGLSDSQILIQRGFLDLLVTHLPLSSPLLQNRVSKDDLVRLVSAASEILLRREMSLNRRLWTWFLGPDSKSRANAVRPQSPEAQEMDSGNSTASHQYLYFNTYGRASLERSLLSMFSKVPLDPKEKARPFRISLSLMDRWEIGGSIIPHIFVPAMDSAYRYSSLASAADTTELNRSVSLFFDGIETHLIWSDLLRLLQRSFSHTQVSANGLALLDWITKTFNVEDEEMLTIHMPLVIIYALHRLEESGLKDDQMTLHMLELMSRLLDMVTFSNHQGSKDWSKPSDIGIAQDITGMIETFYFSREEPSNDGSRIFHPHTIAEVFRQQIASITATALNDWSGRSLEQVISLFVASGHKDPLTGSWKRALLQVISDILETAVEESTLLPFPKLSAIIAVLALPGAPQFQPVPSDEMDISTLEAALSAQLWQYLSPTRSKYHVETAKHLWQVHDIFGASGGVEASLTSLLRDSSLDLAEHESSGVEQVRRFAILWDHSIPSPSAIAKNSTSTLRRGSTFAVSPDAKQATRRLTVLETPLMLVLDLLDKQESVAYNAVVSWLSDLASLEQILRLHFDQWYASGPLATIDQANLDKVQKRCIEQKMLDTQYLLTHFLYMIKDSNDWFWQTLEKMTVPIPQSEESQNGLSTLADLCCQLVSAPSMILADNRRIATTILLHLVRGPAAASLQHLDLDLRLMAWTLHDIQSHGASLETTVLKIITAALRIRASKGMHGSTSAPRARPSTSDQEDGLVRSRLARKASGTGNETPPPPQYVDLIRAGFTAPSVRPCLKQWLRFVSETIPLFPETIFANAISLVECLCAALNKLHDDLVAAASINESHTMFIPEASVLALLDGLEMILSRIHTHSVEGSVVDSGTRMPPQPRNIIGSMTTGLFKVEGPSSRSSPANSRLTAILTLQDAIRVTFRLWTWASHHTEAQDFDQSSALTSGYGALRVRNKSRQLLEQIFSVEPLEGLEVIVSKWAQAGYANESPPSLDLLHVMRGSRPKTIVPAILDALCSRTNANILDPTRLSSQTIDLSALDVALFLSGYLQSIEDDALDEIWSDCTAFLRDVLGNPLPYRQILPALLSLILLLAQKLDYTNFGEQRKMRRELGDVFLRLLSATLTAHPQGYTHEYEGHEKEVSSGTQTNSAAGRKDMTLFKVLTRVVADIDGILETTDRVLLATNNIATALIAPLFHSRSFPANISGEILALLLQIARKAPTSKTWKKEMADVFNDPRLLAAPPDLVKDHWFPVLRQWCLHDKDRMQDLLSRLTPPSSAGIMFGVGASAARIEADRKTQLNLRRICLLMLASAEDTFVAQSRLLEEKLVELFGADLASSPSATIKSELFMVCRATVLSTSAPYLSPMWPILNDNLQAAITSLFPNASNRDAFGNLSLVQACKLLDLLITTTPDEFQLHEWLYITDTIDAVYQPADHNPAALSDQVAEVLASESFEEGTTLVPITPISTAAEGRRRPLINNTMIADAEDIKAMGRDDFARTVLRPFLSQLSINAYEGVYSMDAPDLEACKRSLLEDLLDTTTIVE